MLGSVYEFGSIAVEEDEIIDFAKLYDPQTFHIDPEIAKRLNKKVVVVAGIHWDELSMKEIEIIMEACRTITEKVITEVQKR